MWCVCFWCVRVGWVFEVFCVVLFCFLGFLCWVYFFVVIGLCFGVRLVYLWFGFWFCDVWGFGFLVFFLFFLCFLFDFFSLIFFGVFLCLCFGLMFDFGVFISVFCVCWFFVVFFYFRFF